MHLLSTTKHSHQSSERWSQTCCRCSIPILIKTFRVSTKYIKYFVSNYAPELASTCSRVHNDVHIFMGIINVVQTFDLAHCLCRQTLTPVYSMYGFVQVVI